MATIPLSSGLSVIQTAIFNILEPDEVTSYNELLLRVGRDIEAIISEKEQRINGVNGRNPNPHIDGDMGVDPIPPKILVIVRYKIRRDNLNHYKEEHDVSNE